MFGERAVLLKAGCLAASLVLGSARFSTLSTNWDGTTFQDPAWVGSNFNDYCKPDDPNNEVRECEKQTKAIPYAANKVANCESCVQRCHVWGDPHMAPFLSDCTVSVFSQEMTYTFWKVSQGSFELDITVRVEREKSKIGKKPWIHDMFVNGELKASKDSCKGNAPEGTAIALFSNEYYMMSDHMYANGGKKAKDDVKITLKAQCVRKHNVWGLEILLELNDEGTMEHDGVDSQPLPYSMSTRMLKNDVGACVDFLKYGQAEKFEPYTNVPSSGPEYEELVKTALTNDKDFNCGRCSDPTQVDDAGNRNGGATGCAVLAPPNVETGEPFDQKTRKCGCVASCSIFGDPYVTSLYTVPSRAASKKAMARNKKKYGDANFQVLSGLPATGQVLYQIQNQYAVMFGLDPCAFMSTVQVFILKKNLLKKYQSCNADDKAKYPPNYDFKVEDFDVYNYDAAELCADNSDFNHKDRKSFTAPPADSEHYDPYVDAYKIGLSASVSRDGENTLYPLDVSARYFNTKDNVQTCLNKANIQGTLESFQDQGSVRTVLKCHRNAKNIPYFNVCIYRDGMELYNSGGVDDQATTSTVVGQQRVQDMEANSLSSGWCALGDFVRRPNKNAISTLDLATQNYIFRQAGDNHQFSVAQTLVNGDASGDGDDDNDDNDTDSDDECANISKRSPCKKDKACRWVKKSKTCQAV